MSRNPRSNAPPPPLILSTRPEPQAQALVDRLQALGYRGLAAPALRIERCGSVALRDLVGVDWLAFTSANAVRAAADDLGEALVSAATAPAGSFPRVVCVGDATATTAKEAGLPNPVSVDGDAAALAAHLTGRSLAATHTMALKLLHLRGEDLAVDLRAALSAHGWAVSERILYRAAPCNALPEAVETALRRSAVEAALVLSARTARAFRELASPFGVPRVAICISAAAAEPLSGWCETLVAERPRLNAVLAALQHRAPVGAVAK